MLHGLAILELVYLKGEIGQQNRLRVLSRLSNSLEQMQNIFRHMQDDPILYIQVIYTHIYIYTHIEGKE